MSHVALSVQRVSKKFRRGELYDSLRDLVPALTRRLVTRPAEGGLRRREFWALRDVTFDVAPGEAFGIIGPNGAGKSTMLKLLARIMRPTEGSLSVRGRLSALIEVSAGFHPDLTGRENIFLNGTILGMTRREIRAKFDRIVEFSGLGDFIDTPVKRYSSGMYARLGFSVAAHVDPDVLVVDEVLSVGDYAFQQKCTQRMQEVLSAGATVIFVSHNLRAVQELCGRSLLLEGGATVELGPTAEVVKRYLADAGRGAARATDSDAEVTAFRVSGAGGEALQYASGETVRVDVEVRARRRCERAALVLVVRDENNYLVFDTSTQRLGCEPVTLEAGEVVSAAVELDLHFAQGTYRFGLGVLRYDNLRWYAPWYPAATVFVTSKNAHARGTTNLYPRLLRCEQDGGTGAAGLAGAPGADG
jgi:lipopolysaccharide transport system ATP-binding protein